MALESLKNFPEMSMKKNAEEIWLQCFRLFRRFPGQPFHSVAGGRRHQTKVFLDGLIFQKDCLRIREIIPHIVSEIFIHTISGMLWVSFGIIGFSMS
ncbi:MAG: hypothetical protein ACYCXP_08370 [Leptospirillum sp.]